MLRVVSDKLWENVRRLAKRASHRRAAVAYVSTDDFVRFGAGDTLVTDASNRSVAEGLTSAQVLARALDRKAELYSVRGLHAKVFVLGRAAVIGSANLSKTSRGLVEAGVVTDEPAVVAMASSFVDRLQEQATRIDERFIKRISRGGTKGDGNG